MKRKIFNVLFALVLVLSFSMITALPASAQTFGSATLKAEGTGGSSAEWSQLNPVDGIYSAKLIGGLTQDGSTYAAVVLPMVGTMELNEVTEFIYNYFFETGPGAGYGAHICFYTHDPNDGQTGEISLYSGLPAAGNDIHGTPFGGTPGATGLNTVTVTPATTGFFWYGTESESGLFSGLPNAYLLSDIQAAPGFADHVIDRMQVEYGWWGAGDASEPAYVDVVTLNGVDYDLEFVPQAPVNLGTAASFAVLAGSAVTNTGNTVVTGDLGLSPGTAITGFFGTVENDGPGVVIGAIEQTTTAAAEAQADLTAAYLDAAGRTADVTGTELGSTTKLPGAYSTASGELGITGTLTLDADGDPDAVFIFQAASTLTTDTASVVELINEAKASNVFWQVGSSATLGTSSTFIGTILALTAITVETGSTLDGRALARNAAVTFSGACTITVPDLEGPAIVLTPAEGVPLTEVTVHGYGFTGDELVNIYFDSALVGTSAACTAGVMPATTFNVPAGKAADDYTVDAVGVTSGINAFATFTVPTPYIDLTPDFGPPGTVVTVTGGGLTAGGLVKIYYCTVTTPKTVVATNAGAITTTFTVPDKLAGPYTVTAKEGLIEKATHSFTISTPTIDLDLEEGPPGTVVTITGENFKVGGTVTITFDGVAWAGVAVTADGTGDISTTRVVPDKLAEEYTVVATDTFNTTVGTTFTVSQPTITLNPEGGPPGLAVTVAGGPFKLGEEVTIEFDAGPWGTDTADGTTGLITGDLDVPAVEAGEYVVTATDGVNTATETFIVGAAITLDADSGVVGDTVTVTGLGFTPDATVTITGFGTSLSSTIDADGDGAFTKSFVVPDKLAGIYTVTAADGTNTATDEFTLTGIGGGIGDIEAKLDSGVFGLAAIKDAIDAIDFSGLADIIDAIKTAVDAIQAKTDTIDWANITAIKTQTDKLGDATIGLAAIKTAIEDIGVGGGGVASASDTDVSIALNAASEIIPAGTEAFWGQLTVQSTRAGYNIEVYDGDSWVPVVRSGTVAHSVALSGFGLRILNDTTVGITVDYVFVYHLAP